MSILAKKEIMIILRYERKLVKFAWEIEHLKHKAPNKNIKEMLQQAANACWKDAEKLTTSCPLKEQIGEG